MADFELPVPTLFHWANAVGLESGKDFPPRISASDLIALIQPRLEGQPDEVIAELKPMPSGDWDYLPVEVRTKVTAIAEQAIRARLALVGKVEGAQLEIGGQRYVIERLSLRGNSRLKHLSTGSERQITPRTLQSAKVV